MRRARPDKRRILVSATAAVVIAALLMPPLPALAAHDFPPGYEAYHTYAEMVAELDAAVAAYPSIVRKFSIGRSYEGRTIWAVKISDNVAVDEAEPEVVFDSLIHGREHLTVEMNLYLLRLLTTQYGKDSRITRIVNSREIFIIPMLNPDGGEYDIAGHRFRSWRKNRQPTPGSTAIGTDPNRNFGFKWGCCNGSSGKPADDTYRGPAAWSAPETKAYRDFVRSRVVGGRQQLRVAITWHSSGELILWPYGYTSVEVPKTMTADDAQTFAELGRQLAARNGYTAFQSSDLYVTDGDQKSWAYYEQRIFQFTFEMGPRQVDFYPTADRIGALTRVNRDAVLWLIEQADCPYRAAGLAATRCGPFDDDFEMSRGWTFNAAGTDTATSGRWQRGVPQRTSTSAGVKQRAATPSGQAALVTGLAAGSGANANDVDGGVTSALSPAIRLGSGRWTLAFNYSFAHDRRATSADSLRVRVVAGSSRSTVFTVAGAAHERNAAWARVTRSLDAFAGRTIRILVEATDAGSDALIEAAIDDLRVYRTPSSTVTAGSTAPSPSVTALTRPLVY